MAKTARQARQGGSKLKAELEVGMHNKIEQAKAAVAAAKVRLDGAAGDDEKAAAQAELDQAGADLGRYEKGAATIGSARSVAELIADGAPEDGRVVVTVIGPAKGRRRAGYRFSAVPSTVAVTVDELALIEADADLSVTPGDAQGGAAAVQLTERLPAEAFLDAKGKVRPIKVLGPAKGRRRAGYQFGAQAITIEPTRSELDLILGDADLSVAPDHSGD